ncbi:hypothetical protein POM88_002559 [Heracleum sosnowskyi]|uniref:Uncharacterized protein n=1 Tax=Heracleum sosnowskyi TaxID=360622 RepID=A0AAD8JEX9_9APIA|nr:hypothetical protein POM88_002559 [Heracleum sosnowskyi]
MNVQEEHVVDDSVVDSDKNTVDYQEVPRCLTSQKLMLDEALASNVNDRASSSRGNSDFGLWCVDEFIRTSMTELNTDIITDYRDLFTDLQRWGFNVNWLLSYLKYIEHLQISQSELHSIDSRPDDAKNKLQDLQSHCLGKITEIVKASG